MQDKELESLRQTVAQCMALEKEAKRAMDHATTTTTDSKVKIKYNPPLPQTHTHTHTNTQIDVHIHLQLYREHSQNVEAELVSVQLQLSNTMKENQRLSTILAQSAHTIQATLQVYMHSNTC